jgi:hypothetical protein
MIDEDGNKAIFTTELERKEKPLLTENSFEELEGRFILLEIALRKHRLF